MAKIKLPSHLKDVESGGDWTPVKPGMYIAEVAEINDWKGQYGEGMEVVFKVTSNSKGETKNVEGIGSQLWRYLYIDYEPQAGMLVDFLDAVGAKRTGVLDTNKIVGTKVQVRVKTGKNLDGEYRPEIGRVMALAESAGSAEPEEPEPDDEPEAEPEPEGDAIDLDTLDRNELKALIKQEGLGTLADLGITTKSTDDDIRDIIAEKLGGEAEPEAEAEPEPDDEPEPEPEEEPEPEPEPEDDGLDAMDRDELKKLIKAEELGSLADLKINRNTTDDEIRDIIRAARGGGEEPEPKADYSKYTPEQLKAELKERGIALDGRFSKSAAVKALKEDDGDDSDPF